MPFQILSFTDYLVFYIGKPYLECLLKNLPENLEEYPLQGSIPDLFKALLFKNPTLKDLSPRIYP